MKKGLLNGFSFLHNHRIMLMDKKRTLLYRKAIRSAVKKNSVCMDMGSGVGVLSFFAAQKKCRKVYAVERVHNLIACSRKTAEANGLAKKITFVESDVRSFRPPEKIGLLIHEQVGCFIWDEDMVSNVSYVRDRYLSRAAIMIPYKIDIYFAPVSFVSEVEKSISFWQKRRYGIDFSNLQREALVQYARQLNAPMLVSFTDQKDFLTREKRGHTIDLRKDSSIPQAISLFFDFKRAATTTGMCIFFKVHLDKKHVISTAPRKENTSWRQIFLHSLCPLRIPRGGRLRFTLFPAKSEKSWRWRFQVQGGRG